MTKDEALKLALKALENNRHRIESKLNPPEAVKEVDVVIAALHQALEQPEQTVSLEEYKRLQRLVTSQGIRLMEYESRQEPVAWGCQYKSARLDVFKTKEVAEKYVSGSLRNGADVRLVELYTAPPKREWVGLTDEEIAEAAKRFRWDDKYAFASAVWWAEEKLKEKNHG